MTFRILHWVCRIGLGCTFLYTGYIKLDSPLQFAVILYGYQLFPTSFLLPLSEYFPWFEIALGVLLLTGWKMRYAAIAASGLLASFIAMLTLTYLRGIDANCGCFSFDDRMTPLTIARNGLIILPALYLVAESFLQRHRTSNIRPQASN